MYSGACTIVGRKGGDKVIVWLVLVAAGYLTSLALKPVLKDQVSENYKGEHIPTGLGLAFVLPTVLVLVLNFTKVPSAPLYAVVILFFSILGILDDNLGSDTRRGFRGHFGQRDPSTGILKAVGGFLISLAIAISLGGNPFLVVLHTVLIALNANFINLLDRAPGRAGKVFAILSMVLVLFNSINISPLLWLLASTIGYLVNDLKATMMMGDTGSNPLGAALGLGMVLIFPLIVKVLIVLLLIVLNFLSEKISFSKVIESNRFLKFMDQLGR